MGATPSSFEPDALSRRLLDWYDRSARTLPWRAPPGSDTPTPPYRVWLSEIMLQQTTVAAVIPYYQRFVDRWPTLEALAAAPLDDVLAAWAGLGYYSRARNLHACAAAIVGNHGGAMPRTEEALRTLPGIGAYTAAAIAAIAFDQPATVVDGNIERVMARLHGVDLPLPAAKPVLRAHAAALTPRSRPGDHAQALMDLGATLCTPRKPACLLCPLSAVCRAHAGGAPDQLPRRAAKAPRPQRYGAAFWLECDGHVLLRRRPHTGLLGGMLELPTTPWTSEPPENWLACAPVRAHWRLLPGRVRHVFTHFELDLQVAVARLNARHPEAGLWTPVPSVLHAGLPSVMRKAAQLALTQREDGAPPDA